MKTAFIFSGQGAQYPAMMKDLYDASPEARAVFELADSVLERDISGLCFSGTQDELNLTHNTQPCVLTCELAALAAVKAAGITPSFAAGFSLGEYGALVCAEVLTAADALKLIQLRADAMQSAVPVGKGGMAAIIGSIAQDVEALCSRCTEGYVIAANYNCPGQTVISGEKAAVSEAVRLAGEAGLRAVELAVSAPFHCKMMSPAADALEEYFKTVTFSKPNIPVFMNTTAEPLPSADKTAELLVLQAKSPVLWEQTLLNLSAAGAEAFVEIGPGRTLSGFVKKTVKGAVIQRVESTSTLSATLEKLANAD